MSAKISKKIPATPVTPVLPDEAHWEAMRKANQDRQARIAKHLEDYRKRDPKLTPAAVAEMGEFLFNAIAIDEEDGARWTVAQQVQLKRETQALEKRRLQFELRKYRDQVTRARDTLKEDDLTFEEKEAAMKKILGIKS